MNELKGKAAPREMNAQEVKTSRLGVGVVVAVLIGLAFLVFSIIWPAIDKKIQTDRRLACGTNLARLGQAMRVYCDEFHQYPTPSNWCDLLMAHAKAGEQVFKCPGNKKARSGYALNPDARPTGPPDMVVLFEAKGGWNQNGGPELLTLENHGGRGCNMVFNSKDVHSEWVRAGWIPWLCWRIEDWNFRWPKLEDLQYWLENMIWYHRFSNDEIRAATGLTEMVIETVKRRVDIRLDNRPKRAEDAPLLVLPYPGGRHPRIGFLEGAVDPQRETKFSVFTPWDANSYVVVDVPEAIWSNLGLTYLAHTHIDTIWTKQGIELEKLEWNRYEDGGLEIERRLPNGIVFAVKVQPTKDAVLMEMRLANGTGEKLTDLRVQNCVMTKMAKGFEQQTNENKVLKEPYAACRSGDGKRWIITAWQGCHRTWANEKCPCFHSDPKFPDLEPGQEAALKGRLWFYEGTDIEAEFARIKQTDWPEK